MKGKGWINLTNPLVASQNFEYKMSNILDKPLESLFGYISVLPGALSAYRYKALTNHEDGTGPLAAYFKGEDLLNDHHSDKQNSKTNFFEANMYLAEDRILCWELVAKRKENWVLKFVKLATGETDVPENLPEFISQRRRWINGAFFAALYALRHSNRIWATDHSFARKFWFQIEFAYQFVTLVFSFFSLSNFYLTFYFLTGSLVSNKNFGHNGGFWIFTLFNYLCICILTSLFIVSIGNRPQASFQEYFQNFDYPFDHLCLIRIDSRVLFCFQHDHRIWNGRFVHLCPCEHCCFFVSNVWPIFLDVFPIHGSLAHVYMFYPILLDDTFIHLHIADICFL